MIKINTGKLNFFVQNKEEDRYGSVIKRGEPDEDFSGRIKNLEAKLKGTPVDKKPKDLLRAIGMVVFILYYNI